MTGDRVPRIGAAALPLIAGGYLLVLFNGESSNPGFLIGGVLLLAIGLGTLLWGGSSDSSP